MSAVDLWTLIGTWLVGWGDAFLGLEYHGREIAALWPIHPADVDVRITNAKRTYEVRRQNGVKDVFGPHEVLHIMGQSFDGLRGSSPLSIARQEIALTMAAQRMATQTYANTAVPRGVLTYENQLTDDAINRVRADWQRIYGGSQNAGKVAILEEGMDFKAVSLPLRDVQWIEQQQLSVQVIARLFRVPLSLIQADTPGGLTYRTAETENLQFLIHGVRPWYVRIEQALNRSDGLFPTRPLQFAEFLPAALLRVATKERFESYAIATGGKPWMMPSEVRAAENLPPDDSIDDDPEPPKVVAAPAAAEPAKAPADKGKP
jgi:HK97 family phage portal protein